MADRILRNGSIVPMVEGYPANKTLTAVAVKDGIIMAVGSDEEVMMTRVKTTDVVDLLGATLLPGFIEPHTHPMLATMESFKIVDLGAFNIGYTADDVWNNLRAAVKETPKGEWIHGSSVNPLLIPDLQMPTRKFLDTITSEHPLTLVAVHLHTMYCNSMALEAGGITADLPDPPGGVFGRDEEGELDGALHEPAAMGGVAMAMPKVTPEEGRELLRKQAAKYAKHGYTTVVATGLFPMSFEDGMTGIYDVFGDPSCPVRMVIYQGESVAQYLEMEGKSGLGGPVSTVGVKFWADGSPYAGTMATAEPYLDTEMTKEKLKFPPAPGRGMLIHEPEKLYQGMLPYHKKGLQLATHAHGERSIELALQTYARLLESDPTPDPRFRIEHCGLMTREQLSRAKELGVTVSFYPDHIHYYGVPLRDDILGEERAHRFMPIRTADEVGLTWTFHSDTPCTPLAPLRVLRTVTTREAMVPTGGPSVIIGPEQSVPTAKALKGYTSSAAWQVFHEDLLGSIEVGKIADFTILSKNPLEVDPKQLDSIEVVATYRSGNLASCWKTSLISAML